MRGREEEEDGRLAALLEETSNPSSSSNVQSIDDEDAPSRTGNEWTALAHIMTGVIGSGVLSLAWSMAQLGWVLGPFLMLFFAAITYICKILLSHCYRSPDPEHGPARHHSYLEAVGMILGKRSAWVCNIIMKVNLFKTGVIYVITSAISVRAIRKSNCYHEKGHRAHCEFGSASYMLLFGIIQIVTSQLPEFHSIEWLSIISAAMSATYSTIGFTLGLAKVIESGEVKGSIGGVPTSTAAQKVIHVCQAFGSIAFAYPFTNFFFEVQDTLKSPPSARITMKKASKIAVYTTAFFYLCCGGFGYAAFGNSTPGNLLTGFGFYEPYWLIDFANACVLLHLVGGYQIFSQTQFAMVERWAEKKYPEKRIVTEAYSIKLSLPARTAVIRVNLFRVCFRSVYVVSTTAIAMLFPYFNEVLGVAGAFSFWPTVVYFPVEMYMVQKNIGAWTKRWLVLRIYSLVVLVLSMFALVGSIKALLDARFS